jgi:hypothetical protein
MRPESAACFPRPGETSGSTGSFTQNLNDITRMGMPLNCAKLDSLTNKMKTAADEKT